MGRIPVAPSNEGGGFFQTRTLSGSTPAGPAGGALGGTFPNPRLRDFNSVKDSGATGNGVTDDTAAFNTALAIGSTYIPPGTYVINGVVTVPPTADLRGSGTGTTTLKLGAGGQIKHGARTVNPNFQGGYTGDFTINGNSVANVAGGGLYVGLIINRMFSNIVVTSCITDNCVVEAAQNCNFHNFQSRYCNGAAMVWDYGMGCCSFTGHTELYSGGTYNLDIRQSGASPAGAFPTVNGPSYNMITSGFIENSLGGVGANVQNSGLIHHGAGTGNTLFMPNGLAGNPNAGPYSLVIVEKQNLGGTNAQSTDFTFLNFSFADNTGRSIGLDMRGNSSVIFQGKTTFLNLVTGISSYDTDVVQVSGPINWATVQTKWLKNAGAGATTMQAIVRGYENTRTDWSLNTPADTMAFGSVNVAATTTIAAGSNGVNLNTAPGTINVASTTGFSPAGVFYVMIGGTRQQINYTGVTSTSFTGCTLGNGAAGVLATGQAVSGADPAERVNLTLQGLWLSDGQFSPIGVTGWQYYTPDGGTTKYLYNPGGAWVGGNLQHVGTKSAVNGNTAVVKAGAIAAPTDLATSITAINAIRVALQNFGITS